MNLLTIINAIKAWVTKFFAKEADLNRVSDKLVQTTATANTAAKTASAANAVSTQLKDDIRDLSDEVNNKLDSWNPSGSGTLSMDRAPFNLSGMNSTALGIGCNATNRVSVAIGDNCTSTGEGSFAEGHSTIAAGKSAHAEGYGTIASGAHSHAEGCNTTASGAHSHAEGCNTTASGAHSHAEGYSTTALGAYSHAEGYETYAKAPYSHAHGKCCVVPSDAIESMHRFISFEDNRDGGFDSGTLVKHNGEFYVCLKYIQMDKVYIPGQSTDYWGKVYTDETDYAFVIGNGGEKYKPHSNAHTVDWYGNAWFAGDVYVKSKSGAIKDEGSEKLLTETDVLQILRDRGLIE